MKRLVSVLSGMLAGAGVAVLWRRRRTDDVPGSMSLVGRRQSGDMALAERVRLELFGDQPTSIAVAVHRGVVTLRGEVPDLIDIASLDARTRRIEGVNDVTNLLRLRQASSI